ncbi:MAG: MBL fold metallo-hydrolase [Coriobacteriia bacterium]|nr:MBL fold metallo-hydrolase [Coriobacteriia bacterium]
MQLTVLGSAASYPDAGRACSGHLVRSGETSVLLDCGNGVLANLGKVIDPTHLSAVFISHAHVDHFADVYALQAALRYAPAGPVAPLPLYAPSGVFELMQRALTEHGAHELAEAFEVHELAPGAPVRVGKLTVTPHPVDHVGTTFALVVDEGDARLCYTSDTRAGDAVAAAASGALVLLADATLPPAYAGRAPHMTAFEAALLAQEAGARTLVLTHLWPTVDRVEAAEQAREAFGGRVIVADEMDTLDIE